MVLLTALKLTEALRNLNSLFSSGKYHLDIVSCSEINNRKRSTVCEIIFAEQTMGLYEAKIYSLLKCYQKKRKACYCELCFFLSEVNSYGLTEKICRRYKTKGTPQYPIREAPIDCEYFSLNRTLVANIERNPTDVKLTLRLTNVWQSHINVSGSRLGVLQ